MDGVVLDDEVAGVDNEDCSGLGVLVIMVLGKRGLLDCKDGVYIVGKGPGLDEIGIPMDWCPMDWNVSNASPPTL